MISLLTGTIAYTGLDHAVIDCHGVGYQVFAPARTLAQLAKGQAAQLFIVTNVREDAIQLYGFIDANERDLFVKLTSVSGVGPKLGLSLLTTLTPAEILNACAASQPKTLARASGVGNKMAEKIVVDLRDYAGKTAFMPGTPTHSPLLSDLTSALINLGYQPRTAETAASETIKDFPTEPFEQLFKHALKKVA
ncbi:MAG TPA: Holliday junction branch migration protein RuvA [Alphaproteobacteria bacterium]|nr:Holliday junction branch migration protein RuvA [Alphaproteobacteria bacterium]